MVSVDAGTRRVRLCERHAEVARRASVESADSLRALFVEPGGRRALLARRARDERRLFPPRPEGRRLGSGRRDSDGSAPRAAPPSEALEAPLPAGGDDRFDEHG